MAIVHFALFKLNASFCFIAGKMDFQQVPIWTNREKINIVQFTDKYLSEDLAYGRNGHVVPFRLQFDAVLVKNYLEPPLLNSAVMRQVTYTEQWCVPVRGLKENVLSLYERADSAAHMRSVLSSEVYSRYTQRDVSLFERGIENVLNGTAPHALYGADQSTGSLMAVSSDKHLDWSLNKIPSYLARSLSRTNDTHDDSRNPVSFVGGVDGLVYFGEKNTLSPPHTEELDMYSINYLVWGEPKLWYYTPAEYLDPLYKLLHDLCQGEILLR